MHTEKEIKAIIQSVNELANSNQFQEALNTINEAIHNNEHVNLLYSRARVFKKMGQDEDSVKDLQRILELNPNHISANYKMARFIKHGKQPELAESYYLTAIKQDPDSDILLESYGYYLQSMGRYDEALRIFLKVFTINPVYGLEPINKLSENKHLSYASLALLAAFYTEYSMHSEGYQERLLESLKNTPVTALQFSKLYDEFKSQSWISNLTIEILSYEFIKSLIEKIKRSPAFFTPQNTVLFNHILASAYHLYFCACYEQLQDAHLTNNGTLAIELLTKIKRVSEDFNAQDTRYDYAAFDVFKLLDMMTMSAKVNDLFKAEEISASKIHSIYLTILKHPQYLNLSRKTTLTEREQQLLTYLKHWHHANQSMSDQLYSESV